MKNNFFSLSLILIVISGCSANSVGIDKNNSRQSAEYIKQEFEILEEITEGEVEINDKTEQTYEIGEYINIVKGDLENTEQINFENLDIDGVYKILDLVHFPESRSIDYFIGETHEDDNSHKIFTAYKSTGISLIEKNDALQRSSGSELYMLTVIYNKERFKEFK